MNINLNLLKSFYYVALYKSFTNAANKLLTSQPSLSYNVKKLEEELNTSLLIRKNNEIQLTEEGTILLKSLDKIFGELRYIESAVSNSKTFDGCVSISTKPLFADTILSKYMIKFNEKFPNVHLKVTLRTTHDIYTRLDTKRADIIIDHLPTGDYKSEVNEIKLGEFHNIFVCSKNFFDNNIKNKNITFEELSEFKLAIPSKTRRRRNLDSQTEKENVKLNSLFECRESNYVKDLISNDKCIAYLAKEYIKDELEAGKFIEISINNYSSTMDIVALIRKDNENRYVKEFIKILEENE